MHELQPIYEVWIRPEGKVGTLIGESMIGLVYTDDKGRTIEVLAAVPRPETRVEYRPIPPRPTIVTD